MLDLSPRNRFSERDLEYEFLFNCLRNVHDRSLLDVGSGRTGLHLMLIACGYIPTSIDLNPVAEWVEKGDVCSLCYKTSEFDCVTCISALEHVNKPARAAEEMIRVLKPGGSLIISFPYSQYKHVDNVAPPGRFTSIFSQADIDKWFGRLRLSKLQYWRQWTDKYWRSGTVELKARETTQDLAQGISLHFTK